MPSVKHIVTSVEHPQTNGQAKAANRVILNALRTRLNKSKGLWKEGLPSILLAYHCSPQTTTNETTFWLTYNRDAIIPIKVGELSTRRLLFQEQHNKENMRVELETKDDVQEISKIKEEETKLRASRRYNTKVQLGAFQSGNLVSRVWGEARKDP